MLLWSIVTCVCPLSPHLGYEQLGLIQGRSGHSTSTKGMRHIF